MTSPQYDRLNDVCSKLASFRERLERRMQLDAAAPADGYLNKRMAEAINPIHDHLVAYRDFHAQHTSENGRVDPAQRERFFDLMGEADNNERRLMILCANTMCRMSNAPGSVRRLSPFFRKVVADESQELRLIHTEIQTIIAQDLVQLKRMPRHLRLLSNEIG